MVYCCQGEELFLEPPLAGAGGMCNIMRMNIWMILSVGIGGFCGSVVRYLLHIAGLRLWGHGWTGTFLANGIGCFVLGCLVVGCAKAEWLTPAQRLCLTAGFCGGLTTLSTFTHEFIQFVQNGAHVHAGAYLLGTLMLSGAFMLAGMGLVTWVVK